MMDKSFYFAEYAMAIYPTTRITALPPPPPTTKENAVPDASSSFRYARVPFL